jgi:Rad3-related DNA helicase
MTSVDYARHFPFGEIRQQQHDAIGFALDAFLTTNKKYVILEMGPGCGKSATGIAIARTLQRLYEENDPRIKLGGAYVLTTQKVLQEQYMRDFGPEAKDPRAGGTLRLLKSASGYVCQLYEEDENDQACCAEIRRLIKSGADCAKVFEMCKDSCKYIDAKNDFFASVEGTTNYSYFLTTSTYTQEVEKRGLLILDEAHNIESVISNFVTIDFSNVFYKTVLGIKTLPVNSGQERVFRWLVDEVRPRLRDVVKQHVRLLKVAENSAKAIEMSKKLERLKRSFSKIEKFVQSYDPQTWVLDTSTTDKKGERIYRFKPIVVGSYCREMLFSYADRVLILSATILDQDVYCESVGINPSEVEFLRIPSPFPVENRPVHYMPVGSMSARSIEGTLPKIAEAVRILLDHHKDDKGIIHTANYRVAKYLVQALGASRLLIHDAENREDIIKLHTVSKRPTVLLSPSMMEGVDLANDLSRFQVLCKVPFPYLGDASVQRRMELNPAWYSYQAVKSVVQAMGRSVRHQDDWAHSYILDSDWSRFYQNCQKMFPDEFVNAVQS